MKLFVLSAVMSVYMVWVTEGSAQVVTGSIGERLHIQNTNAQFLKKSHNQKVISTVLGITGVVVGSIGVFWGLTDVLKNNNAAGTAPDIVGTCGAVLIGAAIPFQIESRRNKKLATRVYVP